MLYILYVYMSVYIYIYIYSIHAHIDRHAAIHAYLHIEIERVSRSCEGLQHAKHATESMSWHALSSSSS